MVNAKSEIYQFIIDILVWYDIITVVNFPPNKNGAEKAYEAIY